jgi:hypothetical protein
MKIIVLYIEKKSAANRKRKEIIDRERAKLNVMIPDLRKKGLRLLEYMADYEKIMKNRMHRLSGLVLAR